jgi:hypothetical protein
MGKTCFVRRRGHEAEASLSTLTSVLLSCGQTRQLLINVPSLFVYLSVQAPKARTRYEELSPLWILQAASGTFKKILILIIFKSRNDRDLRYQFDFKYFTLHVATNDRLCGLVGRVPSYRSRGPGFDSRRYQIS